MYQNIYVIPTCTHVATNKEYTQRACVINNTCHCPT